MSLADLHGYWKYADVVVPFRLPLAPVQIVAPGYVARKCTSDVARTPSLQTRGATEETHDPEISQLHASDSTEQVDIVSESAQTRTHQDERSPAPKKPEQRKFEYEMNVKETVLIQQKGQSMSEPTVSTQDNEQQVFDTGDSQDETQEIGKTDSQLEMDQAIL